MLIPEYLLAAAGLNGIYRAESQLVLQNKSEYSVLLLYHRIEL